MRVYRCLCEEELNKILNHDLAEIGNFFDEKSSNTFKYRKGEKYIHFFKSMKNCEHIKDFNWFLEGGKFFICTFNIPISLLIKNAGFGYYYPVGYKNSSGYDDFIVQRALEFAIPVSQFNTEWLESYEPTDMSNLKEK